MDDTGFLAGAVVVVTPAPGPANSCVTGVLLNEMGERADAP
jgi:hypothetical protein